MFDNHQMNPAMWLPLKAVRIECLDSGRRPIRSASGFIVREEGRLFLYTAWHVVTGLKMYPLVTPREMPRMRTHLRIHLKLAGFPNPGVITIGGAQSFDIPLYRKQDENWIPLWNQDERSTPYEDFDSIELEPPDSGLLRLRVPFWHDAIKLPLLENVALAEMQEVQPDANGPYTLEPGDKVFLVGYPYGYSTQGASSPSPVVLTRFIAANVVEARPRDLLLESAGMEAMSGGPVFAESNGKIYPFGIYTGTLLPGYLAGESNPLIALGTICNLSLAWSEIPLVPYSNESEGG